MPHHPEYFFSITQETLRVSKYHFFHDSAIQKCLV